VRLWSLYGKEKLRGLTGLCRAVVLTPAGVETPEGDNPRYARPVADCPVEYAHKPQPREGLGPRQAAGWQLLRVFFLCILGPASFPRRSLHMAGDASPAPYFTGLSANGNRNDSNGAPTE